MGKSRKSPKFGSVIFFGIILTLGTYFSFASVQGNFGLFRRIQIEAEADSLRKERDILKQEVAVLANKTKRLSDEFLDLDLLDQQTREILGMIRADEVVIR